MCEPVVVLEMKRLLLPKAAPVMLQVGSHVAAGTNVAPTLTDWVTLSSHGE